MRNNPLVTEVLTGLVSHGKAQLDYLGLLLLQASVLFLWWPKNAVIQVLEARHAPDTLIATVIALGLCTAYFALRVGAEEILLPGQHGLRDWALATPLGLGRILRGYLLGHLLHSVAMVALSAPLLLSAFAVSGGEWGPLGWCVAAALVQAIFYRLCGALTHLLIGQHPIECRFTVRAIIVLVYVAIGLLAPFTSHVALTLHLLGDEVVAHRAIAAVPDQIAFLATYLLLSGMAALVLYRLLRRERRVVAVPRDKAGVDGVAAS